MPRAIVSITTETCTEPNNHLAVRQNYKTGFKTNFTLCLNGVLKHANAKSSTLLEWIELNGLLGADHIFIYNFTGPAALDPYLKYYERKGVLTVLPWDLPIHFREDLDEFSHDFRIVWNYAQTAMLNDCLYRNMFVARYLVYLDLDEFIIPQEADVWTWRRMIKHAGKNCTKDVGSYCARNGFFQMAAVNISNADTYNLTTALHTVMFRKIKDCFGRSKYIIIPERVQLLNIHFVQEYYNGLYKACILSPSVGFLHHYRPLNRHKPTETNLAAWKFKENVIKRMDHVYDEVLK
ncbi:hypothetical protein LSH36_291g03049 [Paralvinella palmiformis]|uniref:Glycosyltransferase family 92 protein n=1 Tax=Paralvinella palmiformis TaxID=53620 RepID=A0AAD9N450_9ANNE|nr:hypothetical protein LSH36_291g03049 [Paralvinella palmiformis]